MPQGTGDDVLTCVAGTPLPSRPGTLVPVPAPGPRSRSSADTTAQAPRPEQARQLSAGTRGPGTQPLLAPSAPLPPRSRVSGASARPPGAAGGAPRVSRLQEGGAARGSDQNISAERLGRGQGRGAGHCGSRRRRRKRIPGGGERILAGQLCGCARLEGCGGRRSSGTQLVSFGLQGSLIPCSCRLWKVGGGPREYRVEFPFPPSRPAGWPPLPPGPRVKVGAVPAAMGKGVWSWGWGGGSGFQCCELTKGSLGPDKPLCCLQEKGSRVEDHLACLGAVKDKCGKIRIPGRKAGKKHDIGEAKL